MQRLSGIKVIGYSSTECLCSKGMQLTLLSNIINITIQIFLPGFQIAIYQVPEVDVSQVFDKVRKGHLV